MAWNSPQSRAQRARQPGPGGADRHRRRLADAVGHARQSDPDAAATGDERSMDARRPLRRRYRPRPVQPQPGRGGYRADMPAHQPMPYEAAAYDDLATKAHEAGSRCSAEHDENEDTFQERVHAARGTVLGMTREAGEAAAASVTGSRRRCSRRRCTGRAAADVRCRRQHRPAPGGPRPGGGPRPLRLRQLRRRPTAPARMRGRPHGRLRAGAAPAAGCPGRHRRRGDRHAGAGLPLRAPLPARCASSSARLRARRRARPGERALRVAESVLDTAHEATRREGFADLPTRRRWRCGARAGRRTSPAGPGRWSRRRPPPAARPWSASSRRQRASRHETPRRASSAPRSRAGRTHGERRPGA